MICYSPLNAVIVVESELLQVGEEMWILRGIHVEKRWKGAGER